MPRPTTQAQLLAESQKEYTALTKILEPLSPDQMTRPGALGEWSVKDVLAHVYEWQRMVLRWYEAGKRGEVPATPAEGYKWNQLPALNKWIYEQYHAWPLEDVLTAFHASHQEMQALIQALPPEELFTPGYYPWMRANTLAAYITSSTASHYRWARKEFHLDRYPLTQG